MNFVKIIGVIAICVIFFLFEHKAKHHQPITKDSPKEDHDEMNFLH